MDTNLETGGELVMHRCYMIIFIVYYVDPNQQCLGRLAFPFAAIKRKKNPPNCTDPDSSSRCPSGYIDTRRGLADAT